MTMELRDWGKSRIVDVIAMAMKHAAGTRSALYIISRADMAVLTGKVYSGRGKSGPKEHCTTRSAVKSVRSSTNSRSRMMDAKTHARTLYNSA